MQTALLSGACWNVYRMSAIKKKKKTEISWTWTNVIVGGMWVEVEDDIERINSDGKNKITFNLENMIWLLYPINYCEGVTENELLPLCFLQSSHQRLSKMFQIKNIFAYNNILQ